MAVLGDVLRVLPHIVLGVLQGQRLRKQMQLEKEQEEYERFKREFDVWQMRQQMRAVEEQRRAQEAFVSGLSKIMEEEPTQVTTQQPIPQTTPQQPIQLPTLTVPPSLQITRPRQRRTTTTISEGLLPPTTVPPLSPSQKLQLPTTTTAAPATEIDHDRILNDELRRLDKLAHAVTYVRSYGTHPALQPTASMLIPTFEASVRNSLSKIRWTIADKLVRSGVAESISEVRKHPRFWEEYIAILENYRDIPVVQQELQYAQNEREQAYRIQQRKEDLDWRKEERRLRVQERLPTVIGRMWEGYEQRADRLLNLIVRVERDFDRLIEAGRGQATLTTDELRSIENIINLAGQALVAFGKEKASEVFQAATSLVDALIEGREEARKIAEQLAARKQELLDLLWRKLFAVEYLANQWAAAYARSVEDLIMAAYDVDPQTASRILGMPMSDLQRSLVDFKNALDKVPSELPEEIEERPTPFVPTLRVPPPPSEQLRRQPISPPIVQPTPQPQPTPPTTDVNNALRTLVVGAIAQRATEEQMRQIERDLRIEGQRLLNQLRQVQLRFEPTLRQLRVENMRVGIQRALTEIRRTLQELAFPPQTRTMFSNILSKMGTLVMSLRRRDPASGQLKYLTGDEAASLLFEGMSAVVQAFQGNRQPLQDFATKLKNYEVVTRNLPEDVSAFLAQLLGLTPTAQQPAPTQQPPSQRPQTTPQQRTQQPSKTQQRTPIYPSPEETDLEGLLGGM